MGTSIGGMVFKPGPTAQSEQEIVRLFLGDGFVAVAPAELSRENDTRWPGNIAIESANDALFIYSSEIEQRFLCGDDVPDPTFFEAIGNPHTVLFFCHYDTGGSYGYRIFENGVPVRRRLYSESETVDSGTPRQFEMPWLNAEQFIEDEGGEDEQLVYKNPETGEAWGAHSLTADMLRITVTALFGLCPWDDVRYQSTINYYQSTQLSAATEPPAPTAKQPWWRRLWQG